MQKLVESCSIRISEARRRCIAVENARTLITVGEQAKFREVRQMVPACLCNRLRRCLTLRRQEQEKEKLFLSTSIRKETCTPLRKKTAWCCAKLSTKKLETKGRKEIHDNFKKL